MKRILGKKSALATAVGSSLMGAMLVGALAGCASTTSGAAGSTSTDGTYSAEGTYSSPDGQEEIAVTITVKSNLITAVSVQSVESNGEGQQYQARFASEISSAVVGKELASLQVSTVAGASLTSNGFNSALEAIRSEAA